MSTQNLPLYLLPKQPKLDKAAALFLLVHFVVRTDLDHVTVQFHDGAIPGDVFIDVDAIKDYKSEGFASAVERVVRQHPELLNVPGMQYFVDLFNFNNLTGRLKNRFEDNAFNYINDWPRVGHSCSKNEHMLRVLRDLWAMFVLYFETAAKIGNSKIEYVRNPFCLSGIERLLDALKPEPQRLDMYLSMVETLEEGFDRAAKADQRTIDAAKRIKPEITFTVLTSDGTQMPGAVFRSDDTRMVRHIRSVNPDLGVLVMRRRTGNTAIFVRGAQDLTALYNALESLEPGRWHHETRYKSPFIANGSETREVTETELTPSQFRDLIIEHVVYQTRSQAAVS